MGLGPKFQSSQRAASPLNHGAIILAPPLKNPMVLSRMKKSCTIEILALKRQDCHKLKASLGNPVSLRASWATSQRREGRGGWPGLVCACADRRDRVCSSSQILVLAVRVHRSPPEFPLRAPTHTRQLLPSANMSKSLKKLVEESREKNQPEVDMSDRGISNMLDVNGLFSLAHITQLVLSHNKLTTVPPNVAELKNLEVLNFFNNQIEELPTQISSLQKLKHLNLGMNRLNTLPRGFGSLPALEVLDLTYNNLNEHSLPGNFFYLTTLRALYLSDNDFEILPPDIGKLTKLQILSLRDNDLISLPKEIGELTQLKELHIQGNRLTVLPPELANFQFSLWPRVGVSPPPLITSEPMTVEVTLPFCKKIMNGMDLESQHLGKGGRTIMSHPGSYMRPFLKQKQ
ncbi:Ras suppressor protein 1 [Cricetulus griseus]